MNPQTLIELVHQTRSIILNPAARKEITVKGQADFVTRVDLEVQQFLQKELFSLAPGVQFMGEEEGHHRPDPNGAVWILDPIDGTTNLIYDYQQSAVSLAYYEAGEIKAGVIYNPFTEETFSAKRGGGAFLNGVPIHVTQKAALSDSLISIGTTPYQKECAHRNFRIFEEVFTKSLDIRRGGSAALDLAYVACGRHDAFFEQNLKPWDFAAGSLLVEEAGGRMSGFDGSPLQYLVNQNIFASNGRIHAELSGILCAPR